MVGMLTLTGYVLGLILLILGLRKPGLSMLGAVLLTVLSIAEGVLTSENAIVLVVVWLYSFTLIYSKLKV